jgi:hypothetical protein
MGARWGFRDSLCANRSQAPATAREEGSTGLEVERDRRLEEIDLELSKSDPRRDVTRRDAI